MFSEKNEREHEFDCSVQGSVRNARYETKKKQEEKQKKKEKNL